MILNVRRLLVVAVAMSAMGAMSACGGSSPSAAGPATQVSTTATSTATTTAAAAGGSAQQFCAIVKAQEANLQGSALAGLLAGGGPDAWKTYFDATTAMNQQLVDAAPADIQASVKTLRDASQQLQTTMAAANYDVSKVGSAKLLQIMQTPERTTATTTLVAYVQTQCGIDLTKVGS